MNDRTKSKKGDMKVWWIPQIPGKAFSVPVKTIVEAKLLLDALAEYDLFQFNNNIKPDYANMGGLQIFNDDEEDGGWIDWSVYEVENHESVFSDAGVDLVGDGLDDLTLDQVRLVQRVIDMRITDRVKSILEK